MSKDLNELVAKLNVREVRSVVLVNPETEDEKLVVVCRPSYSTKVAKYVWEVCKQYGITPRINSGFSTTSICEELLTKSPEQGMTIPELDWKLEDYIDKIANSEIKGKLVTADFDAFITTAATDKVFDDGVPLLKYFDRDPESQLEITKGTKMIIGELQSEGSFESFIYVCKRLPYWFELSSESTPKEIFDNFKRLLNG